MDTLAVIEAIVGMGLEMRVKTLKAVRDSADVKLVVVEIGTEFTGEGATPSEALARAFETMRAKVQARYERDGRILDVLAAAASPTPA